MPLNTPRSKLSVVKIGGSLACGPHRAAWLHILAEWGGPLILVPGGGPFADCVRRAQAAMGFGDVTAHRMALVAMGQHGMTLAAHSSAFTLAASRDELDCALNAGEIPVWLPEKLVLADTAVPASWEMTSDSLAAWLARVYGATRLLLIKSVDIPAPMTVVGLAARNIVDPLFPRFAAEAQAEVWIAGPASLAGASSLLRRGVLPGTFVSLERPAMAGLVSTE